jgi:hypothetical protein
MEDEIANDMANDLAVTREELEDIISPWRSSTEKPPFTNEQLVAMAFISCNGALTAEQIFVWITKTFNFYLLQTIKGAWQQESDDVTERYGHPKRRQAKKNCIFKHSLAMTFRRYGFPVKRTIMKDKEKWSMSLPDTAQYLSPLGITYSTHREEVFPFFELPREIRDII